MPTTCEPVQRPREPPVSDCFVRTYSVRPIRATGDVDPPPESDTGLRWTAEVAENFASLTSLGRVLALKGLRTRASHSMRGRSVHLG